MRPEALPTTGQYGGRFQLQRIVARAISSLQLYPNSASSTALTAFFTAVASRITNGGSTKPDSLPRPPLVADGKRLRAESAHAVAYALTKASTPNRTALASFFTQAAAAVTGGGPAPTLRQAAHGSFLNETIDSTNFHAGCRMPFTAGVDIAAGASIRVSFANKVVLSNVETNGTGTFTILAASMEFAGVCTAATLTQATATGGNIAYFDVVAPTAIAKGSIFWLSYKVSDGGGMKRFPWYTHSATNVSKITIGTTNASVPDQTMVVGGGSWAAVAGGAQSFAIVPCAVETTNSSKVCGIGGSSSGVGRSDPSAAGAGVQGYIQRAIAALGFPTKCLAVSGDQVTALAASDTFRISQLAGCTHHVMVVGGNDITAGKTQAEVLAAYQSHINHIKAAYPSIKLMVVTLSPVVSGTYADLAGQTVAPTNAIRISTNTAIKGGALTGVDMICDINIQLENVLSPEDGKWSIVPGQLTNDGLHANSVGCNKAAGNTQFAAFMAQ